MYDNLATYKTWAPEDSLWAQWAKPVLFARAPAVGAELNIPEMRWMPQADRRTAVIVDLPSRQGVEEGLALARQGFRPVPLYNGVYGPNNYSMLVDVTHIVAALYAGAGMLAPLNLPANAPPVFLLDANRMSGSGRQVAKYDNRWCVFPQDMPSASFLVKEGIGHIVVRAHTVQNDLAHILCRYQEKNIKVSLCTGNGQVRQIKVSKPSSFGSLFYRFKVISGLTRNAAGGFGGDPASGSRAYGIG